MDGLEEQVKVALDAAEAMMPRIAKLMRIYYEELVKSGFTHEDAMQIVQNYKPN